jgi:hypothetical protein
LYKAPDLANPDLLPTPIRFLLLVFVLRLIPPKVGLPLLARQFWSGAATIITIVGSVWFLILVSGWTCCVVIVRRGGFWCISGRSVASGAFRLEPAVTQPIERDAIYRCRSHGGDLMDTVNISIVGHYSSALHRSQHSASMRRRRTVDAL